jgi:hypothetical protein
MPPHAYLPTILMCEVLWSYSYHVLLPNLPWQEFVARCKGYKVDGYVFFYGAKLSKQLEFSYLRGKDSLARVTIQSCLVTNCRSFYFSTPNTYVIHKSWTMISNITIRFEDLASSGWSSYSRAGHRGRVTASAYLKSRAPQTYQQLTNGLSLIGPLEGSLNADSLVGWYSRCCNDMFQSVLAELFVSDAWYVTESSALPRRTV